MKCTKVVVIGAGISGLATAVALTLLGINKIIVIEKSGGLRSTGAAITLLPNAWRALDALGVAHKLIDVYDPYHKGKVESGVVQRKALLKELARVLPHGIIRFSSKLISIKSEANKDSARLNYLLLDA